MVLILRLPAVPVTAPKDGNSIRKSTPLIITRLKWPLVGQHTELNCRSCHKTLVFSEAKTDCNQCHNDIHQNTVGSDCSRCHTPVSWLVNNINEIHETSRFPLLGAHRTADCFDCHKSESLARFDVLGVNCIDCHREDYNATTNPKHVECRFLGGLFTLSSCELVSMDRSRL